MTEHPSSRLFETLRRTSSALRDLSQPFALVGGLAVSVRCEPRFTRDIDIAVAVADDAAAEQLVATLSARGFELRLSLEQRALDRLATVRLSPPGGSAQGVVVDLLFASSGIEEDICAAAEDVELTDGLSIPVARAGHLLVMKVLARRAERPQDEVDVRSLMMVLDQDETRRALQAASRIERLGANRGKPLLAEVQQLVSGREP